MRSEKALLMILITGIVLMLSGCIGLSSGSPAPSPTMTMLVNPSLASTATPTPTPTITATPTPKPTLDYGYVDDDFYNVSISLTISKFGDISINNTGGPGLVNLYAIKITFVDRAGNTRGPDTVSNLADYGVIGDLSPQEGSSALIASDSCGMLTHVVVLGLFRDGKTKPLAEEYLQGGYNS
jgi:hypothetical protein